jgi:metal-dependent amidase/aminoacylase/carboxypeptidase family protein
MSLGTMKNRIADFARIKSRGGRGSTKPSDLREIIPIRRGPWENPEPGFGEVDTVAHCGASLAGDYGYSVQYTDVALIWTCLSAQWNKGETATRDSIEL